MDRQNSPVFEELFFNMGILDGVEPDTLINRVDTLNDLLTIAIRAKGQAEIWDRTKYGDLKNLCSQLAYLKCTIDDLIESIFSDVVTISE